MQFETGPLVGAVGVVFVFESAAGTAIHFVDVVGLLGAVISVFIADSQIEVDIEILRSWLWG